MRQVEHGEGERDADDAVAEPRDEGRAEDEAQVAQPQCREAPARRAAQPGFRPSPDGSAIG